MCASLVKDGLNLEKTILLGPSSWTSEDGRMVTLLPPTSTDSGSNPELVGGLRLDDRNLTPKIFLRVLLFSLPQQNGLPVYST